MSNIVQRTQRHLLNIKAKDGASWNGAWRKCKRRYYKEHHKRCSCCRYEKKVELHHIKPRHLFPELALIFTNLIPLCRDCHFHLGHRNNFKTWQPKIKEITEYVWDHI